MMVIKCNSGYDWVIRSELVVACGIIENSEEGVSGVVAVLLQIGQHACFMAHHLLNAHVAEIAVASALKVGVISDAETDIAGVADSVRASSAAVTAELMVVDHSGDVFWLQIFAQVLFCNLLVFAHEQDGVLLIGVVVACHGRLLLHARPASKLDAFLPLQPVVRVVQPCLFADAALWVLHLWDVHVFDPLDLQSHADVAAEQFSDVVFGNMVSLGNVGLNLEASGGFPVDNLFGFGVFEAGKLDVLELLFDELFVQVMQ